MDPLYDEAVAYHEAGHAVVALALGRPVHGVSVLPDRDLRFVRRLAAEPRA